jgi:hypothetical protein
MTLTLWQAWGAVAVVTFLVLLVMAGLHFKDPKQRGALLLIACAVAAAAWPLLLPYWAIERWLWRPLGLLGLQREQKKRAAGLVASSVAHPVNTMPTTPPAPKPPVRAYGEGGKVEER